MQRFVHAGARVPCKFVDKDFRHIDPKLPDGFFLSVFQSSDGVWRSGWKVPDCKNVITTTSLRMYLASMCMFGTFDMSSLNDMTNVFVEHRDNVLELLMKSDIMGDTLMHGDMQGKKQNAEYMLRREAHFQEHDEEEGMVEGTQSQTRGTDCMAESDCADLVDYTCSDRLEYMVAGCSHLIDSDAAMNDTVSHGEKQIKKVCTELKLSKESIFEQHGHEQYTVAATSPQILHTGSMCASECSHLLEHTCSCIAGWAEIAAFSGCSDYMVPEFCRRSDSDVTDRHHDYRRERSQFKEHQWEAVWSVERLLLEVQKLIERDDGMSLVSLMTRRGLSYDDVHSYLHGYSVLHYVCERDKVTCCQALLNAKSDPNIMSLPDTRTGAAVGHTPLHVAVTKGSQACIEVLLADERVHVDCCNREGRTPLHLATMMKNTEVGALLVAHNANPWRRDKYGITCLQYYYDIENALAPDESHMPQAHNGSARGGQGGAGNARCGTGGGVRSKRKRGYTQCKKCGNHHHWRTKCDASEIEEVVDGHDDEIDSDPQSDLLPSVLCPRVLPRKNDKNGHCGGGQGRKGNARIGIKIGTSFKKIRGYIDCTRCGKYHHWNAKCDKVS